ncbi:transcriptional regulator [Terrihabitans soli]|uniref:Transcriptional regulator n=1 Tax=Terrihabitans soli TaxID=708113 RepID=A0A6S6QT70_9HYPH|nr:ChrR family anti-sigma-E factor [Terrihabitans soli]BCJ90462.1 transcriptional regulator [Terrihabitans soli]
MSITHVPSDETMLAYAAGTLSCAQRLVVETHLALCEQSRAWAGTLEEIGGVLIEDIDPVDVAPDALDRVFARIDAMPAEPKSAVSDAEIAALPEPLRHYPMSPWRKAGRGTFIRYVLTPEEGDHRLILFKIDPGKKMPQHSHSGQELTCVISGSYSDESGRYGPGDFEEAGDDFSHRPVIDSDEPCICIVALTGKMKLEGFVGRLLQPFVRL